MPGFLGKTVPRAPGVEHLWLGGAGQEAASIWSVWRGCSLLPGLFPATTLPKETEAGRLPRGNDSVGVTG